MKKFFIQLALVCAVMALACTGAFAAISNITVDSAYTATVTMEADGDTAVITVTGVPEGIQILEVTLSSELSGGAVPTVDNIVHIEQESSGLTLRVYPSAENLVSGATYYVYLSSSATEGPITGLVKVGSFVYTAGSEPSPTPTPSQPGNYDLGDANMDGTVNAFDALLALRHAAGTTTLTEEAQALANINGDETINAFDALLILRIAAGTYNPS